MEDYSSFWGFDPKKLGFGNDDVVLVPESKGVDQLYKFGTFFIWISSWARSSRGEPAWPGCLLNPQGMRCEILRSNGNGWQKGTFRFRLEFIPDPEPKVDTDK